MKEFFNRNGLWLWPLIAMAIITPFTPAIDLSISHYFYDPNHSFPIHPFLSFIYDYGIIPGQIAFAISAILLFLSGFFKKWNKWYPSALVMVLTLAIGSGLITHAILKDHWGRPRPKQVIEFGGQQPFRPYYKPNFFHQPEPSKSFPCGHCTMGFYFFALALIGQRTGNRRLFYGALAFALSLGILLSFNRIAQGGHFLTDTIASAIVMWLTAYVCVKIVYNDKVVSR